MCGRYVQTSPVEALRAVFDFQGPGLNLAPHWNAAPTQDLPVVRRRDDGQRELVLMRWGLVPYWATDPSVGSRMINARGESVAEKPAFRAAFQSRRCLIPADGFYEWQENQPDGAPNKPFYVRHKDAMPFAFAGLWEKWSRPEGGILETFAIVNTAATGAMTKIHERIPVVLATSDYAAWLAPTGEKLYLVKAPPSEWFVVTPIGTHVNNVRNDDERCIAPLDETTAVVAAKPARPAKPKPADERQMKLL
jgi:putative SOS response-associated peptidase YedK